MTVNSNRDPEEDIVLGEQVENQRPERGAAPVVAVRMPRDLLARISDYAAGRGITVSEALRNGAELLTGNSQLLGPTYVSGVSFHGGAVIAGSPSIGRDYAAEFLTLVFREPGEPEPLWGAGAFERRPMAASRGDHPG
jgi:hypothetical protein